MIREVNADDAKTICDIYNYYVENTIITFEEWRISTTEMHKRIKEVTASLPWLVYEENVDIYDGGFVFACGTSGKGGA